MTMPMLRLRLPAPLPLLPLALLLSLLFSLWLTSVHPQLNDDAFSYLRAAEHFREQGLQRMLEDHGWYAYSVFIALADPLLPGGLAASAQILNSLCLLLLVRTFITLQGACGTATQRQLWLAAAVVLLFPLLNEMRHFIIRDVACWAFTLLALQQLLRHAQTPRPGSALLWCSCTLVAALFRLEALLPALLAPVALWLGSRERRAGLHCMLQLQACMLGMALLVLLLALLAGVELLELMRFAWRYYLPLLLGFGDLLQSEALALSATLFTTDNFPGSDNLGMGLLLLVIAHVLSVLFNLAEALGLPLLLLLLYCRRQGPLLPAGTAGAVWLGYAASALLALLAFQFIMQFQTQRYATLLALLLLLLLPGGLERAWQRAGAQGGERHWRRVLAVIACYLALDSLVSFGHSKAYIREAEHWLQQELPAAASLQTNSYQLAWRSGRIAEYDEIDAAAAVLLDTGAVADYLLLELGHSDTATRARLDALPDYRLLTQFANTRGDAVLVYRRQP